MSFLSVNGDSSAGYSNYSFGQDSNGYYITGTVMYNTKAGEVNSHTVGKTYLGATTSGWSSSLLQAYTAQTNPVTSPAAPVPTAQDTSNDSSYKAPSIASSTDTDAGNSLLSSVTSTLSTAATQPNADDLSNDASYKAPIGMNTDDTGVSNSFTMDPSTPPAGTLLTQNTPSDPSLSGPSSGGTNETPPSAQSINNQVNRNLANDSTPVTNSNVSIPLNTTQPSSTPAATLQSMGLQQSYIAQNKSKFGLLDLISGGQRTSGPMTENTSLLGK